MEAGSDITMRCAEGTPAEIAMGQGHDEVRFKLEVSVF